MRCMAEAAMESRGLDDVQAIQDATVGRRPGEGCPKKNMSHLDNASGTVLNKSSGRAR